MKLRWLLLVLLGLHASIWAASPMFEVSDGSSRVETVVYQPSMVVRVAAVPNHPFLIELDSKDIVNGVAIGQPTGWEVVRQQNRLFVRALAEAQETTLLITSATRSYTLELVPAPSLSKGRKKHITKIVFTYDSAPSSSSNTDFVAKSVLPPSPLDIARSQPRSKRNFNYTMQVVSEKDNILPREVFDDGVFTFFKFPRDQQIPAIYKSTPGSKEEWLINTHVEDEFVVAHGISPLWILRLQDSTVGIFNETYAVGKSKRVVGTPLPDYTRIDK